MCIRDSSTTAIFFDRSRCWSGHRIRNVIGSICLAQWYHSCSVERQVGHRNARSGGCGNWICLHLELPECQIGRECNRKHCHIHNPCCGNGAWHLAAEGALQDLTALRWSARAALSGPCSEENFALQKVFLKLPQKACLRFEG